MEYFEATLFANKKNAILVAKDDVAAFRDARANPDLRYARHRRVLVPAGTSLNEVFPARNLKVTEAVEVA